MYNSKKGDNVLEKKNKTRPWKLLSRQTDGKGISKSAADAPPNLKRFFRSYKDNFNKLISVNMFMILGNFPFIFLICNLSGYFQTPYFVPFSDLYQNIAGLIASDGITPYKMVLFGLEGLQNQTLAPALVTYIFYGISALGLFTFGLVNVGTAYILRNIASGEPVFVWHDFWYAVKRNYKQALPFGIVDALVCALLASNLYILITNTAEFFASMLFWSNVVICIVYFFMRYYMYVQMVTFNLSVFKMIKNSLIFSLLGLKRNVLALLGIVAGIILELLFLFGTNGILVPVAVAAPLAILFSTFAYMKVFASYFKIKEIMIDPYKSDSPKEDTLSEIEPLMRDDVTERERLEKIKSRMNSD